MPIIDAFRTGASELHAKWATQVNNQKSGDIVQLAEIEADTTKLATEFSSFEKSHLADLKRMS